MGPKQPVIKGVNTDKDSLAKDHLFNPMDSPISGCPTRIVLQKLKETPKTGRTELKLHEQNGSKDDLENEITTHSYAY